jgi:hypothetical protein
MRFGKPTTRPCDHECRVFREFLWLPLTIRGETRWLEVASVERRYHRSMDGDSWETVRFVNP